MLARIIKWFLFIGLIISPAFAVGAPADVLFPASGAILYTMEPYLMMTPDPAVQTYQCQIAVDPGFAQVMETILQANIPTHPNTIQQVTFVNLTTETPYFMRCQTDDGTGYGAYGVTWEFSILYGFSDKCQPSTEGIYTGPPEAYYQIYDPETPINRTIFQKATTLTWAYFVPAGTPDIQYDVSYNDTVFWITDNYNLSGTGTPSNLSLELNNYDYESPIDSVNTGNTTYNAQFAMNIGNFSNNESNITCEYAMNLNPNLTRDPGNAKSGTILAMAAFLLAIAGAFYFGGRKRYGE